MIYSQKTMEQALTANYQLSTLHRYFITVDDAIESAIDEAEKEMFEENAPSYEEQKADYQEAYPNSFISEKEQDINDFRVTEDDQVNL